ncbi:hypothetical protein NE237_000825 [Protea cynaroides]|uniref:Alpha 1,4-glycosyltransferase domain-containing protein n=1 Tax=Protea cynaroides TaxID=273540 RepID=A0A9Q0QXV3_9MAGN|nr:hypothetical protein NE237_000825 [Protea cynaroides]
MFRTFRNRRRPRYGTQICAIAGALLLLVSVTVLHSFLGSDRRVQAQSFSSSSRLGFQSDPDLKFSQDSSNDVDDVVANPLLQDVDNDGAGSNGDDRIDELDVEDEDDKSRVSTEEEILSGVELEEESESGSEGVEVDRNKQSGYVWDHVVGVKRRAFDKRSIDDQWEDYSGSELQQNSEDRSKIAFASDDQPLDEDVRRKLQEIKGIEDALLLKTSLRVSPLREGWGTWFDSKGDFLRRDRMFKSNLELLNPLNHPLLQDPDGIGPTVLTRGDKLIQKALWNEFKKVPFALKKPLGITGKPRETAQTKDGGQAATEKGKAVNAEMREFEGDNRRRENEIKRAERRTLYDTSGNNDDAKDTVNASDSLNLTKNAEVSSGNLPPFMGKEERFLSYKNYRSLSSKLNNVKSGDSVIDSSRDEQGNQGHLSNPYSEKIKPKFSGDIYADGKRWGYYPGLHPYLSFSDFVDGFFRQGKCSMRVFMVWNSPPWMYSVRYQRGLESLLHHHPDACVLVFSETIELDFFRDFTNDGFKIAVAMPNLDELLKNTPTHVFASVWFKWRKTKFYSTHYSELVRLAALYKYGGLYLDSDILVLKPLSSLNNSVGLEGEVGESSLNGAVMAFRKHSPFIMECLREFYSTYDDTQLRWNGANLLSRVGKKFLREGNNFDEQLELKLQPSFLLFPISPQNITRYFVTPTDENEKAQLDILFTRILDESLTFHFWNSITSALVPEPESLVARLLNRYCLRCLDVL